MSAGLRLERHQKGVCGNHALGFCCSEHLTVLLDSRVPYHPEYQGRRPQAASRAAFGLLCPGLRLTGGCCAGYLPVIKVKQADTIMLGYPLGYAMDAGVQVPSAAGVPLVESPAS